MPTSVGVVLNTKHFLSSRSDSVEVHKSHTTLVTPTTPSHGDVTCLVSSCGLFEWDRQRLDWLALIKMLVDGFSKICRPRSLRSRSIRLDLDLR